MPIFSSIEITKPVPERVQEPVIPLSKREGIQWRMIEEALSALQHAPIYLQAKSYLARWSGKLSGK
jgi:ubiquinol-cytochrome c reductase cytochrome b subunit